jgi:hypothetical protein
MSASVPLFSALNLKHILQELCVPAVMAGFQRHLGLQMVLGGPGRLKGSEELEMPKACVWV